MSPLPQPVHDGFTFLVSQTGQGVGHPPKWIFLLEILEFFGGGTNIRMVQADIKGLRQQVGLGQRVFFFQLQHQVQNGVFKIGDRGLVPFIQHRMKPHFPPRRRRIRIDMQSGGGGGRQTGRIVYQGFGPPAIDAFEQVVFS